MPIVKNHALFHIIWFLGQNDEHWLWTQVISSQCHAIRSYMVASATDLFWWRVGFFVDFIWNLFELLQIYGKLTQTWANLWFESFCKFEWVVPSSVCISKPKPSYLKQSIIHTSHVLWNMCRGGVSLKFLWKTKFSARPDNPMPQGGLSALTADWIIHSVRSDYPGLCGFLFF